MDTFSLLKRLRKRKESPSSLQELLPPASEPASTKAAAVNPPDADAKGTQQPATQVAASTVLPHATPQGRGRLHLFGMDTKPDLITGQRLKRGIYASDRIHTLIVGRTGYGKSRFLLSLIKQHIDNDEGFMVIDSHHDLTMLILSHIPPEKADRVIYINPTTAWDFKRVVQINFLEVADPRDRDVVARLFMDSLEKIYDRWWGPRLDMILMNALYLLLEREGATLPMLHTVLTDQAFREELLSCCRDERVRNFWQHEFDAMPKDASVAVLTKIYKIVQERIILPLFEAERSSFNLRHAMDRGAFIIVDLPEGRITSDLANFVGSLILARLFLAGMTREDTPEDERQPFYVYIDEAYRYTTKSIADILQSLRKYKVYLTLASQFLEQYVKPVQLALPECCDTVVCFAVGEQTARALERLFPKNFGHQTIMNLPKKHIFLSTPFMGVRECAILEVLNATRGPYNPDDIIRLSLERYGRVVDPEKLYRKVASRSPIEMLCHWPVSPAEWQLLLSVKLNGCMLEEKMLFEVNKQRLSENAISQALRSLLYPSPTRKTGWLMTEKKRIEKYREQAYAYGKKTVEAVTETSRLYRLTAVDDGRSLLFPTPHGPKAGSPEHMALINRVLDSVVWKNGWIARVDTAESSASMPDIIVTPTKIAEGEAGLNGYIDPEEWDYPRTFAVEVETDPMDHWSRLINNVTRNTKLGLPTWIVVPTKELEDKVAARLAEEGVPIVENIMSFKPSHPGLVCVTVMPLTIKESKPTPPPSPESVKYAPMIADLMKIGYRANVVDGILFMEREKKLQICTFDQAIEYILKILEAANRGLYLLEDDSMTVKSTFALAL
ncbi:MAG: type IV secretion system DNA-binding domain-containing protein [Candidatus Bathyarchaeia archaeon]